MDFLNALLAAIPAAASSGYGLAAYALATFACVFFIWRVIRNKNLLKHIEKLPPKDRLRALEIEMGGARLAKGLSPEQWLRAKVQRYYLLAFLAICAAVVAVFALAGLRGAQIVNALTIINNDYRQTTNQSLSDADLQRIREAITAGLAKDPTREQAAVSQLSAPARAAYLRSTPTANEKAPATAQSGSSAQAQPASPPAPTALIATNETEPNNDIFNANEVPLNSTITAVLETDSDVDYFTFVFPGNKRDIIEVILDNGSPTLAPVITLYNPDKSARSSVRNTTGGGDVKYDFVAQPGNRHYAAISAYSGSGKYRLTIKARNAYDQYEPNDDILSATPIEIGKTIEANIMDPEDFDYFRFQTGSQTKLVVVVENRSSTLAPRLAAYNPDKSAQATQQNSTAGGDVSYAFEARPDSRYYIAVSSYSGSGKYALTIRPQ